MKLNKKQLGKGILFIVIFALIINTLSTIFEPKNNDKASGAHQASAYAIKTEKENTIDTIIIGDSESYSGISPMEIWKEYGYTSYVCGTPSQPLYQSYDLLKKALAKQDPKIVILEANAIFRKKPIKTILVDYAEEMVPLIKYHDRWKTLTIDDFTKKKEETWVDDFKGFRYYDDVDPIKPFSYMEKKDKELTIMKRNLIFLDKIKELCEENDIKFMIMSVPSLENWNYDKHATVQKYADENGLEYIDMNLKNDEIKINWMTDTRDKGDHLNYKGAKKASRYLGKCLNETGILESHFDDKKYDHWHQSYKRYEHEIRNGGPKQ